jgi:hypothetical protein
VFDSIGEKAGPQQSLTIINQSTQKEKILVPASQVKQLIQHFYWRKMRDDIESFVRVCKECQKASKVFEDTAKFH